MSRSEIRLLFLVAAAAVCLVVVLSFRFFDMGRQYAEKESQLFESRKTWETIASDKESLQVELNALQSDLKEAELSLSEAQERSANLRSDIRTLKQEIESLEAQITSQH